MADDKVAVYNRGQRTYVLKDKRKLAPGQSQEVAADEAKSLLDYRDLVDMSKVAPKAGEKMKQLQDDNAALLDENAKLKQQLADAGVQATPLDDGDEVLTPAGDHGVIVSISEKKKTAKVKLDNGNVSEFKLSDLKPAK